MSTTVSVIVRSGVALSANHRLHWAEANRRRRTIAFATRVACGNHSPLPEPCDLTCTVVHRRPDRRRDASNWAPSFKAALDEVVRCGLLTDDNNRVVTATTYVAANDPDLPIGTIRLDMTFRSHDA